MSLVTLGTKTVGSFLCVPLYLCNISHITFSLLAINTFPTIVLISMMDYFACSLYTWSGGHLTDVSNTTFLNGTPYSPYSPSPPQECSAPAFRTPCHDWATQGTNLQATVTVILWPGIMSKNSTDFIFLDLPGPLDCTATFLVQAIVVSCLDHGFGHI